MSKYRDKKVDQYSSKIEMMLNAIAGKEAANLGVQEILKKDKEEFCKVDLSENPKDVSLMSFDKAVQIGMQEMAQKALFDISVLATSFDRVLAMVEQMLDNVDEKQAKLYRKRLEILTEFERISAELANPYYSKKFQ